MLTIVCSPKHGDDCLIFKLFCLQDFGDYLESYYSVQTNEGEKISQLIAGYIDIILKKVRSNTMCLTNASFFWC